MSRLLWYAAMGLCLSCASLHASPASTELAWENGLAYAAHESNGLRLRAALLDRSTYPLRLGMEVTNTGDSAREITSALFRLRGAAVRRCTPPADPEARISELQNEISSLQPNALDLMADVLTETRDLLAVVSGKETDDQRQKRELKAANRQNERITRKQRVQELTTKRVLWEKESLRRTTLLPGHTARGFIEFRCDLVKGAFWLALESDPDESGIQFRASAD